MPATKPVTRRRVAHPKRPIPWTKAVRLYLRSAGADRTHQGLFRDQHGRTWTLGMVKQNERIGSMKIQGRRNTRRGVTITVLRRNV